LPLADALKQEFVYFSLRKLPLFMQDFHKMSDGLCITVVLQTFLVRKRIEHALIQL